MSKTRQLSDAINSVDISQSAPDDAVTLDASGNLLVGKSSFGLNTRGIDLFGSQGYGNFTNDGSLCLQLNRKTSDGDIVKFFKDGTTVGSIGNASTNLNIDATASGRVGIALGGGIVPRYQSANTDNQVDLGNGTYRFKDAYLSGGVYLGGTGSANHLDDYEEGTWTPYFTGATSASYATQLGRYTKIGDVVNFYARLGVSAMSWYLSSDLKVGGLPFTSSNVGYLNATNAVFPISGVSSMGDGGVVTNISTNSTEILFYYVSQSSGDNFTTMNNSHINLSTVSFIISGSYKTDA